MNLKPWSFTHLKTYEQCPRQYAYRYGDIKRPFVETEEIKWGNQVDTALAMRIEGSPLPDVMKPYEFIGKFVDEARATGAQILAKHKYGLTRELSPTGFWSTDVWHRGELDLALVGERFAAIKDWKTGKQREEPTQLDLYAGSGFQLWPQVKVINASFVWLQTGVITPKQYEKSTKHIIWQGILPRVERMERARRQEDFPERPSHLCPWCPDHACPHWKSR